MNCFCFFRAEKTLKNHESICRDYNYCYIEIHDKGNNMLKYNLGERSRKILFIIYGDLECLPEKISTCSNNPEKSSIIKLNKHTPSGFSLLTHCSFDTTKNEHDYYRGEDCVKVFCKILKEHAERIMYWVKKEMIPLTDEENRSNENQKRCYVCRKLFIEDNEEKVRDHCRFTDKYRGAANRDCNIITK